MTEISCDHLDEYVGRVLSKQARTDFSDHLHDCLACRDAVREWELARRLLKSALERSESPSASLLQRIKQDSTAVTRLDDASRRNGGVVLVAACTLIAVVLGIWFVGKQTFRHSTAEFLAQTNQDPANTSVPVSLSFPDDVIGVPVDIGDPNVTVVWLYPVVNVDNEER